ncbi:hypothetical protein VII00023_00260 [Vibrio ichthyoenteri ATCC 700023]|uniref:DUF2059 domain-containing protein n=1 Tax=Vibrio ichthyoenteri ATCC 700023 TaxID=870968 RepID=F9RX09_9VIBR|nr:hypothetical protein [Vibrio ichthyoenteri]EGU48582.1 hypothetical protein VII00023_00260 [Vibrio ichthyoenteri ATCC 700023]
MTWLRKIAVSWLLLLFVLPVCAKDLQAIYQSHLQALPVGSYEQDGYLFIITEARCVDAKKHAGTMESKKAEAKFYALLAQQTQARNVRFAPHSMLPKALATEAQRQLIGQYASPTKVPFQKVADIRLPECTQRQVRAITLTSFAKQPKIISAEQVEKKMGLVLASLVNNQRYSALADMFSEPQFVSLFELFSLLSNPQQSQWQSPSETKKVRNLYDLNGVLAEVAEKQGLVFANVLSTNKAASEALYQNADALFKQGLSADLIEESLSLAININPQHAPSWKLISSLFRVVSPNEATYAAKQYFLYSGGDFSAWVYLFKALEKNQPEHAKTIKTLMSHVVEYADMTAWEVKQIQG